MTSLEQEILSVINNAVGGEYIGKFKVFDDNGIWTLLLHINQEQAPMCLAYEGTFEQFKKFLFKEFRTRQMERVSYWNTIQILPSLVKDEDGELDLDYDPVIIT